MGSVINYNDDVKPKLALVAEWAMKGVNQRQIAKNLGVSERAVSRYKAERPEFKRALDMGKKARNYAVDDAIFKSCTGFKETVKKVKFINGRKMEYEEEIYVPPKVEAQKLYAFNKMGDQYKERKEIELLGKIEQEVALVELTPEERKLRIESIQARAAAIAERQAVDECIEET